MLCKMLAFGMLCHDNCKFVIVFSYYLSGENILKSSTALPNNYLRDVTDKPNGPLFFDSWSLTTIEDIEVNKSYAQCD